MLTIDKLKEFGADTSEGLSRCMDNEDFYLKMVAMGIGDERFGTMRDILEKADYTNAFEMAHALKGVLGNLALTPILDPVSEITEHLRAGDKDVDYLSLCDEMEKQLARLKSLID